MSQFCTSHDSSAVQICYLIGSLDLKLEPKNIEYFNIADKSLVQWVSDFQEVRIGWGILQITPLIYHHTIPGSWYNVIAHGHPGVITLNIYYVITKS